MAQRISVGLSTAPNTIDAFSEAAELAGSGLSGAPDLCVTFAGGHHLGHLDAALLEIRARLAPRATIGCAAAGVLGPGRELEDGPGAVVWAAELPGAEIETFAAGGDIGDEPELLTGIPVPDADADAVIVLADPYRFPAGALLGRLNEERPGTPVLGGLASAAVGGTAPLIRDGAVADADAGAVGCVLRGVDLTPCVSQGATPAGPEMAVTAAEGNVIHELAFKPALERLGEVVSGLDLEEREQAARGNADRDRDRREPPRSRPR